MSKCAAIQMASSPNISSNLIEAERLIAEAVKAGAKLVALPENFALMGQTEFDKIKNKEQDGAGPIQDFLANSAKKHAVWIVAGTMPIADPTDENKILSACLVYNDQGERVARYDKIHLFDVHVPGTEEVYRESDTISKGSEPLVIDSPFGKLGIAICYDLRFPELFRTLQEQGMEVLILPSAFTEKTGAAHWELLLRARAVENLCYVIAPNQGGFHVNGRQTYGHSMIIDPWGTVLDCKKTNAGFVAAEIDLARLHKTRESFPVLQHRQISCR
ncbi:MAG: carbon-nitrogen hydrolase family protein [Methyloprofundus sp.]|nr:carbon-nitrogen hydrolase family protein [Methyloprofundus sp.]